MFFLRMSFSNANISGTPIKFANNPIGIKTTAPVALCNPLLACPFIETITARYVKTSPNKTSTIPITIFSPIEKGFFVKHLIVKNNKMQGNRARSKGKIKMFIVFYE